MSIDYARILREDARLRILQALAAQPDERLHSEMLRLALAAAGIERPRDWLHQELRWLEIMAAVRLVAAGELLVAELTEAGAQHLARTAPIEGIRRAPRPEV
jgi:hypothetical protein